MSGRSTGFFLRNDPAPFPLPSSSPSFFLLPETRTLQARPVALPPTAPPTSSVSSPFATKKMTPRASHSSPRTPCEASYPLLLPMPSPKEYTHRVSVNRMSPALAPAMIPALETSESVRVDFPWSTWAITDMFRMLVGRSGNQRPDSFAQDEISRGSPAHP